MQTFRRLNDGTRYYGMTWRGWLMASAAGAVLYLSVRLSPLDYKPTITLTVFAIAAGAVALYAVGGQALGPGRYVLAIVRWRLGATWFVTPGTDGPVSGGVLVDTVPVALTDRMDEFPGQASFAGASVRDVVAATNEGAA